MRAVIFDIGRVLVHWDPQATLAGLARISRADETELQRAWQKVYHEMGTGALSGPAFHGYLIERAGTDADWLRFFDAFCAGLCRDDRALDYVAQWTVRGAPLGIISNTNAVHAEWLETHLPELAGFRSVVWSSTAGLLKPDHAIYRLALNQMGAAAADTLFVDDLEENVAGAGAAGLTGWLHRDWDETSKVVERWLA